MFRSFCPLVIGCACVNGNNRFVVITSYSIHYTKLYDHEFVYAATPPEAAKVALIEIDVEFDGAIGDASHRRLGVIDQVDQLEVALQESSRNS